MVESSGPILARISGLYKNQWNRKGLGIRMWNLHYFKGYLWISESACIALSIYREGHGRFMRYTFQTPA